MAIELLEDTARTVELYPDEAPASALFSFFKPGGSVLADQRTATVDSTATTIASVVDSQTYTLASTSGVVAGRRYRIQRDDGQGAEVEISGVVSSTKTITLASPPAIDPAVGDDFLGLRLTYALSSTLTADRGMHYRAAWEVTPADGSDVKAYRQVYHVVRQTFRPAADAETVKRYLAFAFPSASSRYKIGELELIAERASAQVKGIAEATGRYASLFGDADAFRDSGAGLAAVKLQLVDDGLIPQSGNIDVIDYTALLRDQLREFTRQAIQSCSQSYDKNDDNAIDPAREVGPWTTRVTL